MSKQTKQEWTDEQMNTFAKYTAVMVVVIVIGWALVVDLTRDKNPAAVNAETTGQLRSGYVFCMTEDALDQFSTAFAAKDDRMIGLLYENKMCSHTGDGHEYSVLDRGWFVSKIRVWVDDGFIDVWVPVEALG